MGKTKNKLTDLHNTLFEELERLNDDGMSSDELKAEIERSKAICSVSNQIIANGALALKAEELRLEYNCKEQASLPEFLGN